MASAQPNCSSWKAGVAQRRPTIVLFSLLSSGGDPLHFLLPSERQLPRSIYLDPLPDVQGVRRSFFDAVAVKDQLLDELYLVFACVSSLAEAL